MPHPAIKPIYSICEICLANAFPEDHVPLSMTQYAGKGGWLWDAKVDTAMLHGSDK